MLGLLLCEGFSLVVQSRGCSLVVKCGLLVMVASRVVEHGLFVAEPGLSLVAGPGTSLVAEHGL